MFRLQGELHQELENWEEAREAFGRYLQWADPDPVLEAEMEDVPRRLAEVVTRIADTAATR